MRTKRIVPTVLAALVAAGALGGLGTGGVYLFGEWRESVMEASLAHGGYVIYLRHADRFAGPKETLGAKSALSAFSDCAPQRNLTPRGRQDAAKIGKSFNALNIPVGTVIALPLCRTRETAMLAFGHADLDPQLYDAAYVRSLLAVRPPAGTNTVLVDSKDQVWKIAGIILRPGEVAVFAPDGRGKAALVGRLDQDDLEP